jgi:hypothetical protein
VTFQKFPIGQDFIFCNRKVNITKTYLPQPSGPRTLSRTTTLAIDLKEKLKSIRYSKSSGFVIVIDFYSKLV